MKKVSEVTSPLSYTLFLYNHKLVIAGASSITYKQAEMSKVILTKRKYRI